MSKVEQLIQELFPDGVERVALGDIGSFKRGKGVKKENLGTVGTPVIHYGQIYTEYGVWAEETVSFIEDGLVAKPVEALTGDLLITISDVTPTNVGKTVAWVGPGKVIAGGDMLVFSHDQNPKYLSYVFQSDIFQRQKLSRVTGGTVRHLSADGLNTIAIPLPPLEIQEEIVRILDQFVELDRELEREIGGREKQFAEIADSYLDSGWQTTRLGDLVEYSRTRIKSADLNPHDYTGVENLLQDFEGRMPGDKLPPTDSVVRYEPGDVLLGNIRPYLKKAWLAVAEGGASNDVLVLSIQQDSKSVLLPAWLHRVITSNSFLHYNVSNSKGAKMPRGDKKMILDYQIPLPPLEVQEEITTKLDTFTEYIDSLKRERELRQKQYEYYRDQLLDFKVKE